MTLRDSEPVRIFTSSTASGPPSPRGEGHNAPQIKACLSGRARHFHNRGERSVAGPRVGVPIHERRRGEAHRRQGWVGGVYPSAPIKARTAAFDGQHAYPRAARSAGLRFAVILLSKAMNVGRDHLIHRKRSPFPYEGKDLTRVQSGRDFPCRAQLLTPNFSLLTAAERL